MNITKKRIQMRIRDQMKGREFHIGSEELLEYILPSNPYDPYMTKAERENLQIKLFRARVRMKLRGNRWEE